MIRWRHDRRFDKGWKDQAQRAGATVALIELVDMAAQLVILLTLVPLALWLMLAGHWWWFGAVVLGCVGLIAWVFVSLSRAHNRQVAQELREPWIRRWP